MDDLALIIFHQAVADESHRFTFILEEPNRQPLFGNRTVLDQTYDSVRDRLVSIDAAYHAYAQTYNGRHGTHANNWKDREERYVESVTQELIRLSHLLRSEVWPDANDLEGRAFAKRFIELESLATASSAPPHLLIVTNEPTIPWWITKCTDDPMRLIGDAFGVGMVSTRASKYPEIAKARIPPIKICFITCPTWDLVHKCEPDHANGDQTDWHTRYPEVEIDEIASELRGTVQYNLLSGRRTGTKQGEGGVWRDGKGLTKSHIQAGFRQADVVVYHGHFRLPTIGRHISGCSFEVSGEPPNERNPVPVDIRNVELDQKDLVLIACESAGMPLGSEETLAEYLAEKGSTLVGTLYPILDAEARAFARELSKNLFREYLSWGESLRKARVSANVNNSLFHRAAYCHFGIPWRPSPAFNVRKKLDLLVPKYMESVFNLLVPTRVYSSVPKVQFVPAQELSDRLKGLEIGITKHPQDLLIAAVPVAYLLSTFRSHRDRWVILGPMVASTDDVYLVSNNKVFNFFRDSSWERRKLVYKGSDLTASAFVEILLHKKHVSVKDIEKLTLMNDCTQYMDQTKHDIGLIVLREDIGPNDHLPGKTCVQIDTQLSKEYGGLIPRILWVARKECMEGENKRHIEEFFLRLNERITSLDAESTVMTVNGCNRKLKSQLHLYPQGNGDDSQRAIEILCAFTRDWADLDPKKRSALKQEDFYKW